MKKRGWNIIAVAMLLAVLAGCGAREESHTELTIGYFPNVTHATALVLKAEGSLEETLGSEVQVDWVAFNAGPAEVEALFAEEIDIGYIGPVPAINANIKSNDDVQVLSGVSQSGAVLVSAADAQIESVADLEGKTVAIPQIGNTQHLCLLNLLEENGLSAVADGGTVNVTAVSNADVANMMSQGHIDAALVPEPWGTTLEQNGAQIVLSEDEIFMEGAYPVAVVVVRKEYMEANPDIVEAFMEKHVEASLYIKEHTKEAAQTANSQIESETGKVLSDTVLAGAFSRIVFDTELQKEAMGNFAQICLEQSFIAELPDENLYANGESSEEVHE